METHSTIAAAILRFDMRTPRLFHEAVAASLDAVNAQLFDEIWKEAIAATHWRQCDLAVCAREASSSLQRRFAFLDRDAADIVASAAAFMWR